MVGSKIKLGEYIGEKVELELIGKEFYCRYCNSIKNCRGHRSGYWWMGIIEVGRERYLIIDGGGETERFSITIDFHSKGISGSSFFGLEFESYPGKRRTFQPDIGIVSYTTGGGWTCFYPLPQIKRINNKLEEKIENVRKSEKFLLTEDDFIYIIKSLFPLRILKIMSKVINLNDFKFSSEYAYLTPLLKAYRRSRTIYLPYSYEFKIVEISNSFTAKLMYNESPILSIRKRLDYDISYDLETKTTKIEDFKTHTTIELLSKESFHEIKYYDRYDVGIIRIDKSGKIEKLGRFDKERFIKTFSNYAIFKVGRDPDPQRITSVEYIDGLEVIGKNVKIIQERIAGQYSDVYLYYIQSDEKVLLVDKETLETTIVYPNFEVNNMVELFPLSQK